MAETDTLHDPVAGRLGYLLRRASLIMMADLGAALTPLGLRPVEATILTLIGANPRCNQSEIGRFLGVKRANMVPLIAGLMERKLIDRTPVDGRSTALTLTVEGEKLRAESEQAMDRHEGRFRDLLTGVDTNSLTTALRLIAAAG